MKNNVLTHSSAPNAVVFGQDFNQFENIKATQAWSLFLTGGRRDQALGLSSLVGRSLNFSLIAIAGISWILLFRPF